MGAWSSWDNPSYCWVVICKNVKSHRQVNLMYGHKIPLGETDAFAPLPEVTGTFTVRCDECGKEYSYGPEDVLRFEMGLPAEFSAHPLFK
jgi:hypothetical protein